MLGDVDRHHNITAIHWVCYFVSLLQKDLPLELRLDSRYLEVQGTLWNTSRYPYFDISDLQNWGKYRRFSLSRSRMDPLKTLRNIRTSTYQICRIEENTVDSRYLEVEGTIWNTSRYPYFDMSDLQNWGKYLSNYQFHKWQCNVTALIRNICWEYCGKGE